MRTHRRTSAGLQLNEKSVPGADEDTDHHVGGGRRTTRLARSGGVEPVDIGVRVRGFGVAPVRGQTVGHGRRGGIGLVTPEHPHRGLRVRVQGGTEGMFVAQSLVKAGEIKYGLGYRRRHVAGRTRAMRWSTRPRPARQPSSLGPTRTNAIVAEVLHTYSWTTDTPDFWRREYMHYPRHGSRFTGEPAYFRTSMSSAKGIMEKLAGLEPSRLRPRSIPPAQRQVPDAGRQEARLHPGAARDRMAVAVARQHLLRGLADRLDRHPRHRQAGRPDPADLVRLRRRLGLLHLQNHRPDHRGPATSRPKTRPQLDENQIYVDYGTYAKLRGKIRMGE